MADTDTEFNIAQEYWAAFPREDLGPELMRRTRFNTDQFFRNPLFGIARKSYRFYYTLNDKGHTGFGVGSAGEQGELSTLTISHFQSLIRTTVNLTTQSRPSLLPVAINSDYKSQAQTKVAAGVMDYYTRRELEQKWLKAATESLIMGASYIKAVWDTDLGEQDPMTGQKAGDIRFSVLTPFDVSFDESASHPEHEWMITREYVNKYDVAAKFRPWAQEIVKIGFNAEDRLFNPSLRLLGSPGSMETSLIPVYEFFHKKSAALPDGRYVIFLSDKVNGNASMVLYDGPLPTKNIPVVQIQAGQIFSTPWSFSPFWGTLGMQEAMNVAASKMMTNMATFGGPSMVWQKDAAIQPATLSGAMGFAVSDINKAPTTIDLSQQSGNNQNALNFIREQMQLVSGVNDVARGNPPPNVSSGTALALVQAQAFLNNSDFEKQYVNMLEKTGELVFELLKNYAMTSREISVINGKSGQSMLKAFQGSDISNVDRVQVQVTNPLLRTPAGKAEYANALIAIENPKDRQVFINIMESGRDDTLTEAPMRRLLNIRKENEMLMDGQIPIALKLDNHAEHIQEHIGLLDDPDIRMNPELVQLIMDHVAEHYEYWQTMTPGELAITGLQQLPPDQAPMPPGAMPAPGSPDAAAQGVAKATDTVATPDSSFEAATGVREAKLPTNPATGEQWNPVDGGGMGAA